MSELFEMFSYSFILRALVVGVLISICAALLGVSLTLRKNSMIGDGLSHTAFGAFAIATVLGFTPIYFAMPVVMLASFIILRFSKNQRFSGDTAIALLSASSLAIGTMTISIVKGVNIDLNSYLFGSILAVSWTDVIFSVILALAVISIYIFLHNRIFAITFDEDFARSIGVKTGLYDALFALICSATVVLGMRLLGALLISSLIIFPTLIASQFFKSYKNVVIFSAIFSAINFLVGLILSYFLATPTGATVVIVNLIILIFTTILRRIYRD